MEMTRVDIIGNKKTSYNFLASSEAQKVEAIPNASSRYRFAILIFICLLSILFFLSFIFTIVGYLRTKSDIETLRQEISQLRNELNSRVNDKHEMLVKKQDDSVNKFQKAYGERIESLKEMLENLRENMSEWNNMKNVVETMQSALPNILEKVDTTSRENELLRSIFSTFMNESLTEVAALNSGLEKIQQEITNTNLRISSYIAKAIEDNILIENRIDQLEEFEKRIDQRVLNLNNTMQILNEFVIASALDIRQETKLRLIDVTQPLQAEVNGLQKKASQLEEGITAMNATVQDLSRVSAPDADTEKHKDELESIIIGNPSSTGLSDEELKQVKEELRGFQNGIIKLTTNIENLKDEENNLRKNVTRIEDGFAGLQGKVDGLFNKTFSVSNRMETLANLVQKLLQNKINEP